MVFAVETLIRGGVGGGGEGGGGEGDAIVLGKRTVPELPTSYVICITE